MMMRWQLSTVMLCVIALSGFMVAENFVVNKKKPQKQSMNKLKENYADELAELIRIIPGLQKQLANIQEQFINELYTVLDNDIQLSKGELDSCICKAKELRSFLDTEFVCSLPTKSAFIKPAPVPEKLKGAS